MTEITSTTGADDAADFLDALLQESVQQAEDRKASKALLAKVRQGKASEAEKAAAGQAELRTAWRVEAVCEMWEQSVCECGHSHAYFTQYMVEHKPVYSIMGNNSRWVRTEPEHLPEGIKQKVIYNLTEVNYCSHCSEPPQDAEVIIWENGRSLSQEFGEE